VGVVGLCINASIGARSGGWVATQDTLAFVARLGGTADLPTGTAVLAVDLEVGATASAGGLFVGTSADARFADKSCATGFSASPAVTGVLLDIKTSPITGRIRHSRAGLDAASVGTDFSCFADVVASPTMQAVDLRIEACPVAQQQSTWTSAVSGITNLSRLARFAATTAMTGVCLWINATTKTGRGG